MAKTTRPEPLVSDDEVRAAKQALDKLSAAAGREQPVPDTFIRFILEEAAMVRMKMKAPPIHVKAINAEDGCHKGE